MRLAALCLAVLAAAPAVAQDNAESYPYPKYEISADLSTLPAPVAETRQRLIAAAQSGDIEALRPIIEAQTHPPTVSYGGPDDAVDYLKTYSADGEGLENLAILLELLEAPYAVFDTESDDPSYVWPYLAVVEDLSALTPAQKVDAYRILTHEQLAELVELEAWYHWRVYIGKDGEWQAFVAGD
ncbi:hypothetical protein [uncultured Devosia sp.]|uniref:hypothetical protein n=1 Tax=uncultured Devosia sp. TaxID=211434 RepID=UPI0026257765|nr:hypothetical protein [uncultured Devosia sp.]